jgi:hypothetical protein
MVSYRDVQHLSKKTTRKTVHRGRKGRGSRKGRGTRKTRSFRKGGRSRTHPGRKDFTTKHGNKYFDREGHRYRYAQGSMFARLPHTVKSMLGMKPRKTRKAQKSRKGKKGGKRGGRR